MNQITQGLSGAGSIRASIAIPINWLSYLAATPYENHSAVELGVAGAQVLNLRGPSTQRFWLGRADG